MLWATERSGDTAERGVTVSKSSKALNRHSAGGRVHGAGVIREDEHDPYRRAEKWPDGTQCPQCRAVMHRGAWRWASEPPAATPAATSGQSRHSSSPHLCPACQRIRSHDAAGVLVIDAELLAGRHDQIRATIQAIARAEEREHPLERILAFEASAQGPWTIETTGLHLVRRLGHGLERATGSVLSTRYLQGEAKAVMHLSR